MSEQVVETPLVTTPETPSEWFDHNVRATFHALINNVTLRSESESTTLHALVDGLDKDPAEIIAKLEIAPISGGAGTVDPVLAQVLSDNAALRADVKKLLDALTANAVDAATPEIAKDVAQLETDIQTPEPAPVTTPEPVPAPPAAPEPVAPAVVTTPEPAPAAPVAPEPPAAPEPAPIPPQVPGA